MVALNTWSLVQRARPIRRSSGGAPPAAPRRSTTDDTRKLLLSAVSSFPGCRAGQPTCAQDSRVLEGLC